MRSLRKMKWAFHTKIFKLVALFLRFIETKVLTFEWKDLNLESSPNIETSTSLFDLLALPSSLFDLLALPPSLLWSKGRHFFCKFQSFVWSSLWYLFWRLLVVEFVFSLKEKFFICFAVKTRDHLKSRLGLVVKWTELRSHLHSDIHRIQIYLTLEWAV